MVRVGRDVLHMQTVDVWRVLAHVTAVVGHIDREHGAAHLLDGVTVGVEVRETTAAL